MIKAFIASFRKPKRTYLRVGDIMPPDDGGEHNYGGFIEVCPCCPRINNIVFP